ncbi:uncharacterized protein LOC116845068 [Odontomachus brunneus]|uniref:uncharacterized protein LOC116845068 n=1 Tax=Odontomachus brunneus TaxID=486640 RepID=UPI0013F27A3F|nr:uncharacterized protein LOC116845068 [Odontomachus brunneus]
MEEEVNDKTPEEQLQKTAGKKITIEVDEDDPCLRKYKQQEQATLLGKHLGYDPRFQQQNQTQRCFVMYTDFYRCEHILGEGTGACAWFKEVFKSICPNAWIENWDELRLSGRLAWHKYKTQGAFPGSKYGE